MTGPPSLTNGSRADCKHCVLASVDRPEFLSALTCQQVFEISYHKSTRGRAEFAQFIATPAKDRILPLEVWKLLANPPRILPAFTGNFCMGCEYTDPIGPLARLYALVHPEVIVGENCQNLEEQAEALMRALIGPEEHDT